jgi:hypothetical protein
MNLKRYVQQGSVSLFVVIFAALLIITIATAFIRIMLQDQSQASANDLSKSALDSAYAGVEDTKRAIVEYYQRNCPAQAAGVDTRCDALKGALVAADVSVDDGWTPNCDATEKAGVATINDKGEVPVKTDNRDEALNQAYTCIKVQMNPTKYHGSDLPKLIPLKTKDNAAFKRIKFEWHLQQTGGSLDLIDGDEMHTQSDGSIAYDMPDRWPANRPTIMRLQLLQYGANFNPADLDKKGVDNKNSLTLFLLPTSLPGLTTAYFSNDLRQSKDSRAVQPVSCIPAPAVGSYACEITIELPDVGDPPSTNPRNAFLKVDQLYTSGDKHYTITMLNDAGTAERFADVQAAVDSTGRANDIFRRIRSYIDFGSSIPFPDAAVDTTKSLCKEFLVTNDAAYPGNNPCPAPPQP